MERILVVDDEDNIRTAIKEYGSTLGYEVQGVSDGLDALELLKREEFDLVILDLMMPQLDGFSTCRKIKEKSDTPVIFLSAKTQEDDKLYAFSLGADDYVTKPFSIKELMARVKVVLERHLSAANELFIHEDLEIDLSGHTVKIKGEKVNLTPKEYELLVYLVKNRNIAISRDRLLSEIWGHDYDRYDRTIDTHIKMLRNSLGPYRDLIVTVRSLGYKFEI